MTSEAKTFDVYGNTTSLDESIIETVATRLEARGKHPTFQRMLHEYLDFMDIDSVESVLDLGCGTGFAAREIAKRTNFKGHVTGIDISPPLIEQARTLSNSEGVDEQVKFLVGDSRGLDLEDESFDVVIAHTLISHLPNPDKLLEEMKRLVKPGKFIGIFDGDYASVTFSHPDPNTGKAMDNLIINSIVTQPRILRQLPLLLSNTGLDFEKAYSYVVSDVSKADFWASSVESMRKLLPAANALTTKEAGSWADERNQESENGTFFASSNYYSYVARKPDVH